MRSFGRVIAATILMAAVGTAVHGQSAANARAVYNDALTREAVLRRELEALRPGAPPEPLLTRIRTLVTAYDDMARVFAATGYADNALWQGGLLSADAFWHLGELQDRTTALRMLDALRTRFPTSSLVKQVPAHITRLVEAKPASQRSAAAPPRPAPATPAPPPPATAAASASPAPGPPALLKAIRREVLPDALRVTLELEHEVPFHHERIEGPPRVFVDLQNTRAVDPLRDASLPYSDDVVRQIRIGTQQSTVTRVVLDLHDAGPYSVYSLYDPYRLVIDFERARPAATDARRAPAAQAGIAPPGETRIASSTAATVTPKTDAAAPTREAAIVPPVPSAAATGGLSLSRQLGLGISRIVIDPGHGGRDPGARAAGLTEADLVLDVALRLEKLLSKQPGVEVILTRRTDSYVSLEDRTALANRADADLFLSIHANSSASASVRGVETYFLNFATSSAAEAIAARENAGSAQTMRNLPDIVRAIALNNKIDESRDFAGMVQSSLYERLRRLDRNVKDLGVKQAPFMVLIGATMPSVLAEIGFITHRQEASLVKTERYRQQVAEALLAGVTRYQESLKKDGAVATK